MITDNIQKGGGSGGGSIEVPVTIANGGTGATTAAGARANLGLGDAAVKNVTTSVSSGDTNLITSGGVYTALSDKMDKPSGTIGSTNQPIYLNNGVFTAMGGEIPVSYGGTGASNASEARTNLGLGTAATKNTTTAISSGNTGLPTSGMVYTALSNKMDKPSGSVGSASQPIYLNNGVFTAGNSIPSSVTVTTSMTSTSTSYAAAASLVYNRFVRSIAPVETGTTASSARSIGDLFIDNSGYMRVATSAISSGSSYSSKSTTMTLANILAKTPPVVIFSQIVSSNTNVVLEPNSFYLMCVCQEASGTANKERLSFCVTSSSGIKPWIKICGSDEEVWANLPTASFTQGLYPKSGYYNRTRILKIG